MRRSEFEYPIPRNEAEILFAVAGRAKTAEKTRYYVPNGNVTWEVDVYSGWMEGIAFAEIELEMKTNLSSCRAGWARK